MESWKNWRNNTRDSIEHLQNYLQADVICDDNAPQDEIEKAERVYSILFDAINSLKK